jgi:phytanoyl-CoA dioxygenase PhyH
MRVLTEPRAYWQELIPELTINGDQSSNNIMSFCDDELADISAEFWQQGYLNIPSIFASSQIDPLKRAAKQLADHDIPPVYIYLYDQSWQLFAALNQLLSHFLGSDYRVLPNFWAWHLNRVGEHGWPRHRDCDARTVFDIDGEKMLMSLSLWIPLTDVDEKNGCMYVVPYGVENSNEAMGTPLPALAGSVLGWPQDLFHWGGEYTEKAKNPRSSLSFEFQNCAFDPLAEPLLDVLCPPDFETRLELINIQFEKYAHIDPEILTESEEE